MAQIFQRMKAVRLRDIPVEGCAACVQAAAESAQNRPPFRPGQIRKVRQPGRDDKSVPKRVWIRARRQQHAHRFPMPQFGGDYQQRPALVRFIGEPRRRAVQQRARFRRVAAPHGGLQRNQRRIRRPRDHMEFPNRRAVRVRHCHRELRRGVPGFQSAPAAQNNRVRIRRRVRPQSPAVFAQIRQRRRIRRRQGEFPSGKIPRPQRNPRAAPFRVAQVKTRMLRRNLTEETIPRSRASRAPLIQQGVNLAPGRREPPEAAGVSVQRFQRTPDARCGVPALKGVRCSGRFHAAQKMAQNRQHPVGVMVRVARDPMRQIAPDGAPVGVGAGNQQNAHRLRVKTPRRQRQNSAVIGPADRRHAQPRQRQSANRGANLRRCNRFPPINQIRQRDSQGANASAVKALIVRGACVAARPQRQQQVGQFQPLTPLRIVRGGVQGPADIFQGPPRAVWTIPVINAARFFQRLGETAQRRQSFPRRQRNPVMGGYQMRNGGFGKIGMA